MGCSIRARQIERERDANGDENSGERSGEI
jgi:hypothetical protein